MVTYDGFLMLLLCACLQHTEVQTAEPPLKKPNTRQPDCQLNWNDRSPIILYQSTKEIILPELVGRGKKINVEHGKKVTISCSKGSFKNAKLPNTRISLPNTGILAECKDNGVLQYQTKSVSMTDIECSLTKMGSSKYYVKESVKEMGPCVSDNGKEIAKMIVIGFETYRKYFYPQIKVCFDKNKENTLWTEHILHGKNYHARAGGRDGSWSNDGFFTSDMKDIYYSEHVQDLFVAQLGHTIAAPQKYIARGHMSPNADFVTPAERKATFHYINALPQWQADNNGNWKKVEQSVQEMAESRGTDIKIISGGHGILELYSKTQKKDVSILLGNYNNGPNKVPVPELTWKIVIDEDKDQGVAFIVSNNPLPGYPTPEPICTDMLNDKDICNQLTWLTSNFDLFQRGRVDRGFTYCCTVSDLISKINTNTRNIIPDQGTLSLLV